MRVFCMKKLLKLTCTLFFEYKTQCVHEKLFVHECFVKCVCAQATLQLGFVLEEFLSWTDQIRLWSVFCSVVCQNVRTVAKFSSSLHWFFFNESAIFSCSVEFGSFVHIWSVLVCPRMFGGTCDLHDMISCISWQIFCKLNNIFLETDKLYTNSMGQNMESKSETWSAVWVKEVWWSCHCLDSQSCFVNLSFSKVSERVDDKHVGILSEVVSPSSNASVGSLWHSLCSWQRMECLIEFLAQTELEPVSNATAARQLHQAVFLEHES